MPNLGQLIKNKREAAGLSQKKLGIACDLSDSEIMKIENGVRKKPNWENLCRIAQALEFHPFELLLVAGYITKNDIHPNAQLHGLNQLNDSDITYLQLLIDFIISRKSTDGILKEGL
ncbi:helix-turn-helix domain-containing protein [Sporomusa aerivorans]|uniref:helix-turn-helix domain-containing protein n=1 Tax=Sporomusa aerivorans TaxID=204936 RepID=UPI00352AC79C